MEDGSKLPVLAGQTRAVSPPGSAGSLMFTLLNILLTSCSVTVSTASSLLAGLSYRTVCLKAEGHTEGATFSSPAQAWT